MMEEKYLIEKVGKENPFRVPEGYFDTLSSQIMAKVEAEGVAPRDIKAGKEKRAKVLWLRPVLYAAASVCALFISVLAYQSHSDDGVAAPTQTVVANTLMADEYFDGDETEALLQEAIASLPEVQRTVFTLRYFEEMKYSEMSERLKTSEGSLKASYHIAVKKISEFFKSHD